MKLIVISSATTLTDEASMVTTLFENGLGTFHLRKPKHSTRGLREFILQIPTKFHNRIVIHSHHNLAHRFDLKGIHLTKIHRNKKIKTWFSIKLLKMRKPHIIITSSHKRLASLFDEERNPDYVFLSPVFDSFTSKYQSGFTEHSLKAAMEKTPFQVVARGGVDINYIQKVNDIGFAGMALYSGIWKKSDPVSEFIRIVEKCNELGIKIE